MKRLVLYFVVLATVLYLAKAVAPLIIVGVVGLVLLAWKRPDAVGRFAARPELARLPARMRVTPMRFAGTVAFSAFVLVALMAPVGPTGREPAVSPTPRPVAAATVTPDPTREATPEPTEAATPRPTVAPPSILPQSVVIERSNDQRDALQITHFVLGPGTDQLEVGLRALPETAVLLRWSPDGRRMSYFEETPEGTAEGFLAIELTSLYLAEADGSNPVQVAPPRPTNQYGAPGWWYGAVWSPSSTMVALAWSTGSCLGSPTCNIPESGIDVFDASGRLVGSMRTPDSPNTIPQWSPDSRQIGWLTGRCELNECYNDAFRYRSVQGSEAVSSVPLPPWSEATWSTTNRLLVVASSTHWATVERVYSMALAGGDEQDATWNASDAGRPIWSPDGRYIAASGTADGRLTIRNAQTGAEVGQVPTGVDVALWSPGSDRLILHGGGNPYAMYVVNADGTELLSLGDAQDVAWMPAR